MSAGSVTSIRGDRRPTGAPADERGEELERAAAGAAAQACAFDLGPLTPTIGLEEAARLLLVSPDCLMRRARAGKVPGAKIGRRWVFVTVDLLELIRQKARECVVTAPPRRFFGESRAQHETLRRLDARLVELNRTGRPGRRGKS